MVVTGWKPLAARVGLCVAVLVCAGVLVSSAAAFGFTDGAQLPPDGTLGTPYSFQLSARNGCPPYHYYVSGYKLPPGLSLSTDGLISGVPSSAGTWPVYLAVGDVCNDASDRPITFTVDAEPLRVTTGTLASTVTGKPYAGSLGAAGGTGLTWTLASGALPAGLKLTADGAIVGTARKIGLYPFTAQVTDRGRRTAFQHLTLRVARPLAIAPLAVPRGEAGRPFRAALRAIGGIPALRWSVAGRLPPGLRLDPTRGAIRGVPRSGRTSTVRVAVTDAGGSSRSLELTLKVARKLEIVSRRLRAAAVGSRYEARLTTRGGVVPFRWRIRNGALPAGLRLDRRTGSVTGRPREARAARVTIEVEDALGAVSRATVVIG